MLDGIMRRVIDPPLNAVGRRLVRRGVRANVVTLTGFGLGLVAAGLIGLGWTSVALVVILASRLADGLDGAVARASQKTDFGGFLDIVCDFGFYSAIPLGFVVLDQAANGAAGAFLLASFCFNCASFLGYAVLAEKREMRTEARGSKSLYFSGGLLEGTETIAFFLALCLWPQHFAAMAWVFGALCVLTAASRMLLARQVFG